MTVKESMRDCGWNVHAWNSGGEEAGADAAGLAEAGEVGGEAVGYVHHGGRDAAAGESLGEGNGDARIEVGLEEFCGGEIARCAAEEELEAELGGTEGAGDIYMIAGTSAGAGNGEASGEFADDGDADGGGRADGDVAADEEHAEFTGSTG